MTAGVYLSWRGDSQLERRSLSIRRVGFFQGMTKGRCLRSRGSSALPNHARKIYSSSIDLWMACRQRKRRRHTNGSSLLERRWAGLSGRRNSRIYKVLRVNKEFEPPPSPLFLSKSHWSCVPFLQAEAFVFSCPADLLSISYMIRKLWQPSWALCCKRKVVYNMSLEDVTITNGRECKFPSFYILATLHYLISLAN